LEDLSRRPKRSPLKTYRGKGFKDKGRKRIWEKENLLFSPCREGNISFREYYNPYSSKKRRMQEKKKEKAFAVREEFALLPPIILDDVSTFWAVRDGKSPDTLQDFALSVSNRLTEKILT